jgi:DNA-directed RNA polymerase subunit RPC12/RpoP
MTIYKKATLSSSVVVASSIYSCSSCGYTEVITDPKDDAKECPQCKSKMTVISSSAETSSND